MPAAAAAVTERSRRATAGKRMGTLIGKAQEEDDAFWGHDTWAEDPDDSDNKSFKSSDEDSEARMDTFDSDFDDSEDSSDEDADAADGAAEDKRLAKEEKGRTGGSGSSNKRGLDISKAGRALTLTNKKLKGRARFMGDGLNAGIVLNFPVDYTVTGVGSSDGTGRKVDPAVREEAETMAMDQDSTLPVTAVTEPIRAADPPRILNAKQPGEEMSKANEIVQSAPAPAPIPTTAPAPAAPPSPAKSNTKVISPAKNEPIKSRRSTRFTEPKGRSLRRSTQKAANESQKAFHKKEKQLDKIAHKAQITKAKNMNKHKRRFTQGELLLEAVHETEPENERWLLGRKRILDLVEQDRVRQQRALEANGRAKVVQRFHSRRGYFNTINFPDMDHVPAVLTQSPIKKKPPPPRVCVITGFQARYRDPLTNLGYYDLNAFKELRRRYEAKEPLDQRPPKKKKSKTDKETQATSTDDIKMEPAKVKTNATKKSKQASKTKIKPVTVTSSYSVNAPPVAPSASTTSVGSTKTAAAALSSVEKPSVDPNQTACIPSATLNQMQSSTAATTSSKKDTTAAASPSKQESPTKTEKLPPTKRNSSPSKPSASAKTSDFSTVHPAAALPSQIVAPSASMPVHPAYANFYQQQASHPAYATLPPETVYPPHAAYPYAYPQYPMNPYMVPYAAAMGATTAAGSTPAAVAAQFAGATMAEAPIMVQAAPNSTTEPEAAQNLTTKVLTLAPSSTTKAPAPAAPVASATKTPSSPSKPQKFATAAPAAIPSPQRKSPRRRTPSAKLVAAQAAEKVGAPALPKLDKGDNNEAEKK